jgi:ribosomal protein S18 acetylase RimI-like enzyme
MSVRRLAAADGVLLRDLRMRALRDAPHAFEMTAAEEDAVPEQEWGRRAAAPGRAVFVAPGDGPAVAMAGVVLRDGGERAVLWGMWVDPGARRRGLGRELVEAAADWARREGADRVELWVTDRAEGAAALYRRAGFEATGRAKPLASDPAVTERLLVRRV